MRLSGAVFGHFLTKKIVPKRLPETVLGPWDINWDIEWDIECSPLSVQLTAWHMDRIQFVEVRSNARTEDYDRNCSKFFSQSVTNKGTRPISPRLVQVGQE